jgi:putative peptide maturation dehydrogenase
MRAPASGEHPVQLYRPHILLVERRDTPEFSLEDLLQGGGGVLVHGQWVLLAPHLDDEMPVELADLAVLEAVSETEPVEREELIARFDPARVDALVESGLLLSDAAAHAGKRERDARLRETAWWPPAAVVQSFGRWQHVDVAAMEQQHGRRSISNMIEQHGLPPTESASVGSGEKNIALPAPSRTTFDDLLQQRSTCRNFDAQASIPLAELASVLHRVFGAHARQELEPGAFMLKKNSPSGGGLHPIEAYVFAQRVDGLAAGLYHYQCLQHVLEPMAGPIEEELAAHAHELVAGQAWFANAPVLLLLAARFQRNFWKYRRHPKAWKVIQLDAGHLSQNLYLSATELGYGAFVTGAINDCCAERLFGLDGISTGAIAVFGFGKRAAETENVEFDPLGKAVR